MCLTGDCCSDDNISLASSIVPNSLLLLHDPFVVNSIKQRIRNGPFLL